VTEEECRGGHDFAVIEAIAAKAKEENLGLYTHSSKDTRGDRLFA